MKNNKTITAILGGILVFSVALNLFLWWKFSSINRQVEVFSNQVIVGKEEIAGLQEQVGDIENLQRQVENLQALINQKDDEINRLENEIADNEILIARLESEIIKNQAIIESLEAQQAEKTTTSGEGDGATPTTGQSGQQQQQYQPIDNGDGTMTYGGLIFDKSQMQGADNQLQLDTHEPGSLAGAPTMY